MKMSKPISRKDNIVIQEIDGETLIYDLSKNKAFCLNETSALIWEMCDGERSVSEISKELSQKLNNPANEDLVWLAIDQLKKENLIANAEELENKFEGMNRREVIKKVGLGTMIALPLVSGLIAPTSIHAASVRPGTVPENGSCTSSAQCIQNPGTGSTCCSVTTLTGPKICRAAAVGCIPGSTV